MGHSKNKIIILIMFGGFIGSILRYTFGEWLQNTNGFPVGTLFVNMVGCFLLGWFITYGVAKFKRNSIWVPFIGTGVIGSFTTFSTFSLETFYLIMDKQYIQVITYVMVSVIVGLFFTFLGYKLAYKKINKEGQPI
ncbi:fluoride efflux transporter CrcB [Bacillus luteolus]|uniref:Fluoride-specific ion channel FluC n=1 Tax=Litchfieldia luteola TaxID=682179 RepID=A0ABR9QE96_9BACI|nr:fluoride efflux transporter CrcB [Cytobacillus luteolus]MBE4906817.1 fluoride efflux transporter CrcB [Cytobacillus luteolus]MBP1940529.1 CrcB protein [Cytobacillus luteolus]